MKSSTALCILILSVLVGMWLNPFHEMESPINEEPKSDLSKITEGVDNVAVGEPNPTLLLVDDNIAGSADPSEKIDLMIPSFPDITNLIFIMDDKEVKISVEDIETMTADEVRNFAIMTTMLMAMSSGVDSKLMGVLGRKLLPRFFKAEDINGEYKMTDLTRPERRICEQ